MYKIFKSKEKQETSTDVFRKQSQAVRKSPQIYLLHNDTPNNSYSLNNNRKRSFDRSHSSSKYGQLSPKSVMNPKDFYGKSNNNDSHIVTLDDEGKDSPEKKDQRSPFLLRSGVSTTFPDVEELSVCASDEDINLWVKLVYFGNYSCVVKALKLNREFFKFLNVPPNSVNRPFKFHISIPISEITEILTCVSDVKIYLVLRTIPTCADKIFQALQLKQQMRDGQIVIELDPLMKSMWKRIESLLNSFESVPHKLITFVDVQSLIRNMSEIQEAVIVDSVCTSEKRKVTKGVSKSNSQKLKQAKPNTVIELDDSSDVDEKPVPCGSSSDIVLNYPPNEKDSITISSYDMKCLDEEQFLNDSILGFYLKYIHKELADESIATKSYIFNTFFYGKLSKQRRNEDTSKPLCERVYERVKNWTKSVDIFEKDFLIIPMNKNYHWFLAIVCYPNKVSASKSDWKDRCKLEHHPCIIYMDSLGTSTGSRLSEPIRHFLSMEWQRTKGSEMTFSKQILPDYYPRVPFQTNSSDCGLFVLEYVEQFLRDPYYVLNNLANVELEDWFRLSIIDKKRDELRRLITMLAKESQMECESEEKPLVDSTEAMNVDTESPIPHICSQQLTDAESDDMSVVKSESVIEFS